MTYADELLASLPIEIWTECDDGQALLQLSRGGLCKHIRINSTLSRFEKSAPCWEASHNSGERLPSSDAAGDGADTQMDYDHHTLWNALVEAVGLIHRTSLGWDEGDEHEKQCWDFVERFRKHPVMKRLQKEVLRVNETSGASAFTPALCTPTENKGE